MLLLAWEFLRGARWWQSLFPPPCPFGRWPVGTVRYIAGRRSLRKNIKSDAKNSAV